MSVSGERRQAWRRTETTSTHTSARCSQRGGGGGDPRRATPDAGRTSRNSLIVAEAMQPGALVTEVARRWGIGTGLIYTWRRQMRGGELGAMPVPAFAAVTVAPPGDRCAGAGGSTRGTGGDWQSRHVADRGRLALRRDGSGRSGRGRGRVATRAVGGTDAMIGPPPGTRVYLACGVTDMRSGMDRLSTRVQQSLGASPFDGAVYLFRGRRGRLAQSALA